MLLSTDTRVLLGELRERLRTLSQMSTSLSNSLNVLVTPFLADDLSDRLVTAAAVLNFTETSLSSINSDYQTAITERMHAVTLMSSSSSVAASLSVLNGDLMGIQTIADGLLNRLQQAEARRDELAIASANLSSNIDQFPVSLSQINTTLNAAGQQLAAVKGDITELSSHLTSADSGSSGSGETNVVTTGDDRLASNLQNLQTSVAYLETSFNMSLQLILNAIMHGNTLESEAAFICS